MLIDLIFLAAILIAIFKGYKRGLIVAIFSIIAFIIGMAAALKLSSVFAEYLKGSLNISTKWLPFLAYIVVFFIVILLVNMGGKIIEKAIQIVLLGWLNRAGGILLYILLYLVILSVFIFYTEKLQLLQPEVIKTSQTYNFIQPLGQKVMDNLGKFIPLFKDMFSELSIFFYSLSNKFQH